MRKGFTLVELLVVVTILLIVTVMSAIAINQLFDKERIRESSRQVYFYLDGARSRAVNFSSTGNPRRVGVRLIRNKNLPNVVDHMVYIEQHPPLSGPDAGRILLERRDDNYDGVPDDDRIQATVVRGFVGTQWYDLKQRGLLPNPSRITIIDNAGHEYDLQCLTDLLGPAPDRQKLIIPFGYPVTGTERKLTDPNPVIVYSGDGPTEYELQLAMVEMPSVGPVSVPHNTGIDLSISRVPEQWKDSSGNWRNELDLIFTPYGMIDGASMHGIVHLVLSDLRNASIGQPIDCFRWQSGDYTKGQWVIPLQPNGFYYLCETGGTSNTSEPIWPTRDGESVVDGSVEWSAHEVHDKKIVSIFASTSQIEANSPYLHYYESFTSATPDPFRFAEAVQ